MSNESAPLPPRASFADVDVDAEQTGKDGAAAGAPGQSIKSARTDTTLAAIATPETAPDPPISLPGPPDTDTQHDIQAPPPPQPGKSQAGRNGNMEQTASTVKSTTARTNPAQAPTTSSPAPGPAKAPFTSTAVPAPASTATAVSKPAGPTPTPATTAVPASNAVAQAHVAQLRLMFATWQTHFRSLGYVKDSTMAMLDKVVCAEAVRRTVADAGVR